jgi:hypothetical protein
MRSRANGAPQARSPLRQQGLAKEALPLAGVML